MRALGLARPIPPKRLPPGTLGFTLPVERRVLGRCTMARSLFTSSLMLVAALGVVNIARGQAETSPVEITVLAEATGKPIPCRIHLKDAAGKPQRASELPFWHDHFVCRGMARLELPAGKY